MRRAAGHATAWAMAMACALWAVPAEARRIETALLSNGLTVVMVEEHKAPVVTLQFWYRVGSRDEVSGRTGLSHLTEHLMFKGTTTHGKGEFSRLIAKAGGTENAFTDKDYTAYFENMAADRVGLALELESDRMVNLLLNPTEFQLERDVVKEERRLRTDDDPTGLLFEHLYAAAFLGHPYHAPVIGWMADLDRLTREDIAEHYRRYYHPGNVTLVVVGDFAPQALLPKIRQQFEGIPPRLGTGRGPMQEPEQRGERRIAVKKEAHLPVVALGYRAPNFRDPDAPALIVLSHILSSGKSARLYRRLVYEKKVALAAGGEYNALSADPDLFTFYAMAQPGRTASELESALVEEIEGVRREPVAGRELEKAKNQVEAAFVMGQDSNFFLAMQLGMMKTVGAGVDYFETYLDRIRKVKREDVLAAARRYLKNDTRTTAILVPLPSPEATR